MIHSADLFLRNLRLVLPERTVESGSVVIESGRIVKILSSEESVTADRIIDLEGATLFPGFIDVHIHGAVGVDTMAANAEELMRVAAFLASQGVTAWMPTLVPAAAEEYQRAVSAIEQLVAQPSAQDSSGSSQGEDQRPSASGARVLGVHYEGPFVSGEQCGALHREHFRTFAGPGDLDSLPAIADQNALHMMTVAPEINGGVELISELRRRNWIVSLGHTRAAPDILDQARDAGAQHMTHFMNAMTPMHHRAPGPIGWGLLNDWVSVDVIADGVHIDPMMLKVLLRCVTPSRITLISDAIAATGQGDGEYEIWGEIIAVENGRTRNAHGSIAGSVITMYDAVRMMLSLGASESEVARMASLNPAHLLGIEKDCGSIEEGKRADLVAFNPDSGVKLTLLGGRVAFDATS